MDTTQILKIQKELAQSTLDKPKQRHKRLYRLICDAGWLQTGLDIVLSNSGSRTPGLDGMSKQQLDARNNGRKRLVAELREELLNHTYRP